jgi:transcriptional regulator with XRE-family HTH domain
MIMTDASSGSGPAVDVIGVEAAIAGVPDRRLGDVLRRRRQNLRLGLGAAAERAAVTRDALSDIESGDLRPDPAALGRLLDAYDCGILDLLPPRRPLDPAVVGGGSEAEVLKRYVGQVRVWRRAGKRTSLGFRRADIEVLVAILGTDPAAAERKLIALTSCSRKAAQRFCVVLAALAAGAILF